MPTYCKYCHELGHSTVDCKETPSNKRKCFYCYKAGHIRSQCPEKVTLEKRRKGASSASTTAITTQPSQISPSFTVDSVINMTAKEPVNTEPSQKESLSLCEVAPIETERGFPASQTYSTTNTSTVSTLDSTAHRSKYATPNIEVATTASTSMVIDDEPSPASLEPTISDCSSSNTESMDTNPPFEDAILSPASNKENFPYRYLMTSLPISFLLLRRFGNPLGHRNLAFSLLSLNSNSRFKVSNPTSQKHLIRYIRSKSPTFVALQEIDNSGGTGIHLQTLHQQFCSQQSLWAQYCGLLCFDPQYSLQRIPLPEDSRCILAKVTHVNEQMAPFHILVIYARLHQIELVMNFLTHC
ncbi:hypothetical protein G6F55_007173 [Rhizopus delemar]|nr:hypothetical protein G6F55_007173 [Rhizopus delemar]KAG1495053.1 hypothetical protein G6F54_007445 [Rhizopus delemar]KAG1517900.1 hypothetical protein G6F53_000994 [Rhizopus delemar]KAG1549214.1 hypothetical protein G6F49_009664 [Rhizopus delemar]KAG1581645.1 hypothetical protein G6F48_009668 [Rhizopus delemar]